MAGLIQICDMTKSHVSRETHLQTSQDILCCQHVLNPNPYPLNLKSKLQKRKRRAFEDEARHIVSYNTLETFSATHWNSWYQKLQQTRQHTVTHFDKICNTPEHSVTHTATHTATHCNTLLHTATRCSTLQLFATHCKTQCKAV